MEHRHLWTRAAGWSGLSLSNQQLELLELYGEWLKKEAVSAGGIGPDEVPRVETRHIADSILFAYGLSSNPAHVLDIGTGVGLPGIPLSILLPSVRIVLVDRSERRADLCRRATRILRLENTEVLHGEISQVAETFPAVVSRATFEPGQAMDEMKRVLAPDGVAIVGGSWVNHPSHRGWETIEVPPEILDHAVWLLMMRNQ